MPSIIRKGGLREIVIALAWATLIGVPVAAEPVALRGYNAAIGESSISGISSGAFMAVQFATAWSSVIKGVGVVAGGPFWCARADAADIINGKVSDSDGRLSLREQTAG